MWYCQIYSRNTEKSTLFWSKLDLFSRLLFWFFFPYWYNYIILKYFLYFCRDSVFAEGFITTRLERGKDHHLSPEEIRGFCIRIRATTASIRPPEGCLIQFRVYAINPEALRCSVPAGRLHWCGVFPPLTIRKAGGLHSRVVTVWRRHSHALMRPQYPPAP